jgi:hypothetical protein
MAEAEAARAALSASEAKAGASCAADATPRSGGRFRKKTSALPAVAVT